jgi:hypothetical protein
MPRFSSSATPGAFELSQPLSAASELQAAGLALPESLRLMAFRQLCWRRYGMLRLSFADADIYAFGC